nr:hypothetical protein [uncultured Shinella sp.]
MTLTALLMAGYTFIALRFIDCSLREGEDNGGQWDIERALGLLLCLVWPLALAGTLLVAYQEREIG